MKISAYLLVQTGLLTSLGVAYLEDPPTTADSNTVSDCSWWIVASKLWGAAAVAGKAATPANVERILAW